MVRSRKNIVIITYWSYKEALIQAYTLPYVYIIRDLVPAGSRIYMITFEQEKFRMNANETAQVKQRLKHQGIRLVTMKYSKFGFSALFAWPMHFMYLVALVLLRRIHFLHAWCTPAGSFAYLISKLTGRHLIIDSYEPHAEAMVENKTWERKSIQFRLLFYLEKKLSKHAHIIISATQAMFVYAVEKYKVKIRNFVVKPACVDLSFFKLRLSKNEELVQQLKLTNKIVCVYAGKFGGIYLTSEIFEFFKAAEDYWGEEFRALLLSNHPKNELTAWARETGFDEKKMIIKFVSHNEVPLFMGLGDFAITPVKPIPSKRYCTPIKDGEYWAMGLPVVITKNISDDSDIIADNKIGAVLKQLDYKGYIEAVKTIDSLLLLSRKEDLHNQIRNIATKFRNYSIAENIYREIYGIPKQPGLTDIPKV